jgi:hypothetical protein
MNATANHYFTPRDAHHTAAPRPKFIARATEHWRTAVAGSETYLDDTTPSAQSSLPDLMKPIIKQAEGVLEDAIAYEAARRRKEELKREEHTNAAGPPTAFNACSAKLGPADCGSELTQHEVAWKGVILGMQCCTEGRRSP